MPEIEQPQYSRLYAFHEGDVTTSQNSIPRINIANIAKILEVPPESIELDNLPISLEAIISDESYNTGNYRVDPKFHIYKLLIDSTPPMRAGEKYYGGGRDNYSPENYYPPSMFYISMIKISSMKFKRLISSNGLLSLILPKESNTYSTIFRISPRDPDYEYIGVANFIKSRDEYSRMNSLYAAFMPSVISIHFSAILDIRNVRQQITNIASSSFNMEYCKFESKSNIDDFTDVFSYLIREITNNSPTNVDKRLIDNFKTKSSDIFYMHNFTLKDIYNIIEDVESDLIQLYKDSESYVSATTSEDTNSET